MTLYPPTCRQSTRSPSSDIALSFGIQRALRLVERMFGHANTIAERRLLIRLVIGLLGTNPNSPSFMDAERFAVVRLVRDILRCRAGRAAA